MSTAVQSDTADALLAQGNALGHSGRHPEAQACFERVIALRPDDPAAHNNLGNALLAQGRFSDATRAFEHALALDPHYVPALCNLGSLLHHQGLASVAAACYRQALAVEPDNELVLNNLANALVDLDLRQEAITLYRHLLDQRPHLADAHSNLIFNLDLCPGATARSLLEQRRRWDQLHALPLRHTIPPHDNDPDPDRPLRVGYVSADFRRHSAAAAFGPVLLHHDPRGVTLHCYSGVVNPDERTARFRAAAARWRNIVGFGDEQLAQLIRADRIDILVDLSGHSAGQRLLVFARKPAPIQVTAWGHAVGTGLATMDYLFSDPVLIPPELESYCSERVVHLPNALCFAAPENAPEVGPLPALRNGFVTFGCLNRLSKVTRPTLDCFAAVLRALPGSRLILKASHLNDPYNRQRITTCLGQRGIRPERVELLGGSRQVDHLATYNRIDIALDPFPQNGGVCTLESLWMGVPVVTLVGHTPAGRIGASLLTTLGLTDWIAPTIGRYLDAAQRQGRDMEALTQLRASLRRRVAGSVLGDHRRYCRAVEDAYRQMWRLWCAAARPGAAA